MYLKISCLRRKWHMISWLVLTLFFLFFASCKWVKITTTPQDAKQGGVLNFEITAGESSEIDEIDYKIGTTSGTTTTVPRTIKVNTCKSTGTYYTNLSYSATATYDDGTVKNTNGSVDLTVGKTTREDSDRTYVLYIADEADGTINDVRTGWANAFQDEFDTYTETQYYWAEPRFFTTQSLSFVNSADMAIFLGHGRHHEYRAGPNGSDWVNFTNTQYGNFVPCYNTGDSEYLVSGACQLLSLSNSGGNAWRHFWRHYNSTRLDTRPFSGLHMICGFRTNHHYTYWWFFGWHSSSTDFFEEFAERLDNGHRVRDAWLDSAGDELDFGGGDNRTAVFYLSPYVNDTLSSNRDDYIYGNANYALYAEYWED